MFQPSMRSGNKLGNGSLTFPLLLNRNLCWQVLYTFPPPSQQELMLTGTVPFPSFSTGTYADRYFTFPSFSTGTYADRYFTLPSVSTGTYADRYSSFPLLLYRNLCWQVLYPPPPSLQELMLTGTLPSPSFLTGTNADGTLPSLSFSTGTYTDRYSSFPLLLYRNLCWQVLYLPPPSLQELMLTVLYLLPPS